MRGVYFLCIFIFGIYIINGQDLENISIDNAKEALEEKKEDLLDTEIFNYNGSVGTNFRTYSSFGIPNRQLPFSYGLNANLNFTFFERINMPFSFMYVENDPSGNHPFTKEFWDVKSKIESFKTETHNKILRFGASPYYKGVKLHIAHRNMNFSPYTLNGVTFFGLGTELSGKSHKFTFSGMNGRLTKATPIDLSLTQPNIPRYQRHGWGVKLGYGDVENNIQIISFSARDDAFSIPTIDNDSLSIYPDNNHVVSIAGSKKIYKKITINGEFASSAYTTDNRGTEADSRFFYHTSPIFIPHLTTEYRNALNGSINYAFSNSMLGFKYEKIDPGYKSMGSYFFNNDIENYTVNSSWSMLKQKVQNSISLGFQNNNLEGSKETKTTRIISSVNSTYTVEKFNIGINYSNFQSRLEYVLNPTLDSLNAVIVNEDYGINTMYELSKTEDKTSTLGFNLNISKVSDDIENPTLSNNSNMINGNLTHNLTYTKLKLSYATSVNYNQNSLRNVVTNRIGFGETVSKTLFEDKLQTSFGLNYFLNLNPDVDLLHNIQGVASANYKVKSHLFTLSVFTLSNLQLNNNFSELTVNVNYTYTFAKKNK